jgi:hypothetical protein
MLSHCLGDLVYRVEMRNPMTLMFALATGLAGHVAAAQGPADQPTLHPPQARELDLAEPFHTRSPWRLIVTEGPQVKDYGENEAPGALTLCLSKGWREPCVSDPGTVPLGAPGYGAVWQPHYLRVVKVVIREVTRPRPCC